MITRASLATTSTTCPRVVRYLAQHYPEIMTELQKIVESRSLEDAAEQ